MPYSKLNSCIDKEIPGFINDLRKNRDHCLNNIIKFNLMIKEDFSKYILLKESGYLQLYIKKKWRGKTQLAVLRK